MGRTRARSGLISSRIGYGCILLYLLGGLPEAAQSQSITRPVDDTPQSGLSVCEQAGRVAERTHALPAGLLLAIGRVESGRWDATLGRVVPWPWALDAGGDGRLVDSKAAAIAQTVTLRGAGIRNIDVGCYQIDLASHPLAFADLEQAFDPAANADYAARFLGTLHARFGNWNEAVAAYHSMQPERGTAYRQLVFADWTLRDHPVVDAVARGPLMVEFASGARMWIWTPGNATGGAPMMSGESAPLPHVIIGVPRPR
jgi:hypothetical protein